MSTTFGFMKAWTKEPKEEAGLKTYMAEYAVPKGILLSGGIDIKPDMAQALIEYLQDPANCGQYGIKLDFALFYDEANSVAISGKLTSPYVKGESQDTSPASTRARRKV
jgi:hypothetical protein